MHASPMRGTVLLSKGYPTDEVSVKLDGKPVIITLRNLQIFVPGSVDKQLESSRNSVDRLRTVRDICEGMSLVLHDVGTWNVNTTAFHGAKVCLDGDTIHHGGKGCDVAETPSYNVHCTGPVIMSSAVLPKRRKHVAMSSM